MQLPSFSKTIPLAEQIHSLRQQIRSAPSAVPLRVFYFQLLCITGEWQKALEQLQLCAQLYPDSSAMAQAYRETIRCEVFRNEVFQGRRKPFLMGEPPRWLALLIDALETEVRGSATQAHDLRSRALGEAPGSTGHIDEHPFHWMADSDTRLGPVCELIANGRYYWLPFSNIRSIKFEKVADLRDLVWLPCEVELTTEVKLLGFMPSRYPCYSNEDDAVLLSRTTEWIEIGGDHVTGKGQRTWITDQSEYPMLQANRICLTL